VIGRGWGFKVYFYNIIYKLFLLANKLAKLLLPIPIYGLYFEFGIFRDNKPVGFRMMFMFIFLFGLFRVLKQKNF